ncbi:MAG: hypothetical protein KatS3mg030_198 [Saprospiraceae bacterium]|nr:MAG: hypothetical protein KatS3mg030_198 [Saprospiraceae bacterium]
MAEFRQTWHSKLYRDFHAIDGRQWHNIVRFFEQHEEEIKMLEFDEYFEILIAYTDALFETGAYEKHLLMVDAVIETAFMNNINYFNGQEILLHSLFRKAASCYHIYQLEKAENILRQLLAIEPHHMHASRFLKKCMRSQAPRVIMNARAVAILLLFLTAFVICIEWLWVRPLHPTWMQAFVAIRYSLFGAGLLLLFGSYVWHYLKVEKTVNRLVKQLKMRKGRI